MDNSLPVKINTYDDAVRWLYDRIDYERTRPSGQTNPFRLERVEHLLTLVGSPQSRIPAVHIAGTKGKGSTAAMLASILQAAGLRVGLFTSPHIEQFEERMRVCGQMPTSQQLTGLVDRLCQTLQAADVDLRDRVPTFFEVSTLLGWMYFAEQQAEVAVLETGLGGRLDCTNVCNPLVTIITSIGLDHTHILGDTLSRIAWEKAGIIKSGIPVVQGQLPGDADAVVSARCRDLNSPRYVCGTDFAWTAPATKKSDSTNLQRKPWTNSRWQQLSVMTPRANYDSLTIPLLGQHQAHNASLAVMASELLAARGFPQVGPRAIESGLAAVHWPLRFEVLEGHPTVILDAAHNPDSMRAVTATLESPEWQNRYRVLVFAVSADKDAESMLRIILPQFDRVVLTRFLGNPRSVPPERLEEISASLASSSVRVPQSCIADSPQTALQLAEQLAGPDGVICVTGSLFLAAEARTILRTRR